MSQRPSAATRSTASRVDVDRDHGPAPASRRGPRPARACRRGRRRARRRCRLAGASARVCDAAAQTSKSSSAVSSGRSSGSGRPGARARRRRRCRVDLDLRRVGIDAGRPRRAAAGSASASARRDDPRRRARAAPAKRSPTAATVPSRIPPESVSGLCILPARGDDLEDPRGDPVRVAARALAQVAKRGRVEAEPLDRRARARTGAPAPRGRGARRAAAARRPGSSTLSAPSCSRDLARRLSLHERSLGTYAAVSAGVSIVGSAPLARRVRRIEATAFGHLAVGRARDGVSMPVVWSDRHRPARAGRRGLGRRAHPAAPSCPSAPSGSARSWRPPARRLVDAEPHPDEALLAVHDPALARLPRPGLGGVGGGGADRGPGPGPRRPLRLPPPRAARRPDAGAARGDRRARAGHFAYDTMTLIGPGTWEAARAAVDAALTAADLVARRRAGRLRLLPAARPPRDPRRGFGGSCYLNNAAAAAARLRDALGEPVAVIDIDAHHGNGTQSIFYEDPRVLDRLGARRPGRRLVPALPRLRRRDRRPARAPARTATSAWRREPATSPGSRRSPSSPAGRERAARRALVVALGVDAAGGDPESPLAVSAEGFRAAGRLSASSACRRWSSRRAATTSTRSAAWSARRWPGSRRGSASRRRASDGRRRGASQRPRRQPGSDTSRRPGRRRESSARPSRSTRN